MKLLDKLIDHAKRREFDCILERCKELTDVEREMLMSVLKPTRYEWATLTPFMGNDMLKVYVKECNNAGVWLRFCKDGAHHYYSINNISAFSERQIVRDFYPFLKKLPAIPVEIYTTSDYRKNSSISKVVKYITKHSKYKGYIKIITNEDFDLFN